MPNQDFADTEFELQIIHCHLNPSDFSHEAHLRLAWIQINKYGIDIALQNVQNLLINYVQYVGAHDKYNKTLTIAACHIVHHFIRKSKSKVFTDFIVEFPQLISGFKQLVEAHYSYDIFTSKKAKKHYHSPDLLPFDTATL
ncbi:MAG: hypothetical protein P1U56_02335 [Saprospiraceae bacterium]|nr:hypothetical protein [Saprospiraceae bacterium]